MYNFPVNTLRKALTFAILCCIFISTGFANTGNSLRFKSGTIEVTANVESFVTNPGITNSDLFDGSFYRIIQFTTIPGNETKATLQNAGISLTAYFPDNAYLAIIKANANLNVLLTSGVRAVIKYEAEWKLNSVLSNNELPAHAINKSGYIDLVARYYKGMDAAKIESAFVNVGYDVIRRYEYGSWIEIRVPINKIKEVAAFAFVNGVEPIAPPPTPDDERGRSLHRSSTINTYSPMGRHYDGTGVSAALADDGPVGPHIDYQGRIDQSNTGGAGNGTHGDMTSGILMGAGNIDPTIRGMGTGAFIYIYDIGGYNHILNSPITNQTLGVLVTSTSYSQGCNEYTTDTQTGDQILNQNPTLLHVYSAGNNGGGNCQYGAGAGWGNITGGYKQGKNVITCGNLNYIDALENSSSRGPSEDGRIKPDICANGINQLSTNGPNTYQVGGGTSAACPGVAGIVTQIHQAYRDLNGGSTADGALVKACMLNTAEDLGNVGPDFQFGWGRVNALRAVRTLENLNYLSDNISQGGNMNHNITVPAGTQQLRVMLYWNDVEGDPLAAKALVNDLNFTVTDPSSNTVLPWVLDPTPNVTALNSPAVQGVDDLNNMEQVTINNPAAGVYTLNVDGFMVPQGPQKYFIVYEFVNNEVEVTYPIGYEGFVPGETETIRWDAYGNSATFLVEYSTDNGTTWNTASAAVAAAQRFYNWNVPAVLTGEALIRVTRNGVSGQSAEAFSIIGLPTNIDVDWACPDSIRLTWDAVSGAIGYEVSMLGAMYMDSVATSSVNSAIITGVDPLQTYWFSVLSITPDNTKGRRANAVIKNPGVFNCPIAIDAAITELISPVGTLQDCQDLSGTEITIDIENKGLSPITDVPVFYSVNNGPVVSEIVTGTLNSFASVTYSFTATYDFSTAGSYDLVVWAEYVSDGNNYNDTIQSVVDVISGTLVNLPYSENFETFTACGTANNCGATICNLTNGWVNMTNGDVDDIDWRTNAGGTPSNNTGPTFDHNPGTTQGKYLYTEASACFNNEAIMISPCFDLTTATNPKIEFWFHMSGADMGDLHVDVFANDVWTNDVRPVISGNQGNAWIQADVDLTPFAGAIINVRFRGMTGPDYTSDISIDDFNIFELSAPPVTNFTASATNVCVGEIVDFTDLTLNTPTTWDWVLTPATGFTYVNGTNSNSQHPVIQFNVIGSYDVSLTASNAIGNSNVTINTYITVGAPGAAIPLIETFQSGIFPPNNWMLDNGDNALTWVESASITGITGNPTNASYMDNFTYNAAGQEDGLITERIDLNAAISPMVTFDISYARYSAAFQDALRVDISTDCGLTYVPSGYLKQGTVLATSPDQTTLFTPTNATQWRTDTLDLTGYIGSDVKLKFVNITGYGNSLFIDNINYSESSTGINDPISQTLSIEAFPNPGSGVFTVMIDAIENSDAVIKVTDLKGSNLLTQNIKLNPGRLLTPVDISSFGKGIYLMTVETESLTRNIKLVVM